MSNPLRIALIMQGSQKWIAGSEYIKNIILAVGNRPPDVRKNYEIYLLSSQDIDTNLLVQIRPFLKKILNPKNEKIQLSFFNKLCKKFKKRVYGQRLSKFEFFLKKLNFDFVYPYFSNTSQLKGCRSAAWIPDLQHRHLPQFFDQQELHKRDKLFGQIANHAEIIILSSKTSQSDFMEIFPQAALKSKVLNFKVFPINDWYTHNPQKIQTKYNLPERFYLISNQFWQHKNHLLVFRALQLLKEKNILPNVVCTGHLHDHRQETYSDVILKTIHQLNLAKQVYLLGLIPKLEQIQLIRRSIGLIQPSLFEGWSTVVEEAKLFGKPIILSDLAVNIEQNPPDALFFKRDSYEDLSEKLAKWWDQLPVGPDFSKEQKSKKEYLSEVDLFADRFLKIAAGN